MQPWRLLFPLLTALALLPCGCERSRPPATQPAVQEKRDPNLQRALPREGGERPRN